MVPFWTGSSQVTEEFSEIMTIEKIKHRQLNAKLEEIKCLIVSIRVDTAVNRRDFHCGECIPVPSTAQTNM